MMSLKLSKKSKINKILLVSLTNIGDIILTFPVLDILKKDFPEAKLSIVIGPKAESLLKDNPYLDQVYIFDKHQSPFKSLLWIKDLWKERFDLVVDLRNTAIPIMITPRYRTSYRFRNTNNVHMKDKHLNRLKSVYPYELVSQERCALIVPNSEEEFVDQLIEKEVGRQNTYIVVSPGAADQSKQWLISRFACICEQLIKSENVKVVFVGDENDRKLAQHINKLMDVEGINLCGRTNLVQLAEILKGCLYAIVNDSAAMHMASYLNVPVCALFGPSDPALYGPWGLHSAFVRSNATCHACANPQAIISHTCMDAISVDDVLDTLSIITKKI